MNSSRACMVALIVIVVAFSEGLAIRSAIPISSNSRGEMEKIELKLELLQATIDLWDFKVTVQNIGNKPVFVMTNPYRADGTKGWYVSLDEKNSSVLEISSRIYPDPPYFLMYNGSGVMLKQLSPNAVHSERISIKIPIKETMPPYGTELERMAIDHKNIKFVRAVVGLVPDEEGIREVFEHKVVPGSVTGAEEIMKGSFKGKRLIDLQTVAYSVMVSL
jgi:hypothetical protein